MVGGSVVIVTMVLAIVINLFTPQQKPASTVIAAPKPTVPTSILDSSGPTASSTPPATTSQPQATSQPAPRPVAPPPQQRGTIRLPAGGTATLIAANVSSDGALEIPDGVKYAAYWGAKFDGNAGATVLAGHINYAGAVGAFAQLWGVQNGQQVSIVDTAGRTFHFSITQILTLDKNTLPQQANDLFGQSGAHRLVLVTCGGQWVGGSLGYNENRVVIATPV